MNVEMLEAIVAADKALITALKNQRQSLRAALEMLINCANPDRDLTEIRIALKALRDSEY